MQNYWQSFKWHRNKEGGDIAGSWDRLDSMGRGCHKNERKKLLLFAWLRDSGFGSSYMDIVTKIEAETKQKPRPLLFRAMV